MIPKNLHYCFGLSPDFGGKPWSLVHHVCIMSAIAQIKPDHVHFYYQHEPQTAWWELTKPHVTPIRIDAPGEIQGRPLHSAAHKADVVRLIALSDLGGIYLDADVFVHRSFDPLLGHAVVLGQEGPDGHFGVANAVILSEAGAPFLRRWLDQYHWFRGGRTHLDPFWSEHSVQLPHVMTKLFPDDVTVVDHQAFYWPLWLDAHLTWIFDSPQPIDLSRSYATHLWESRAWAHLEGLTPGKVRRATSNFAAWATPYLEGVPDDYGAPERLGDAGDDRHGRRAAFQRTYAGREWGTDGVSTFFSGVGSHGAVAQTYVEVMRRELAGLRAVLGRPLRILDVGCGDFNIGRGLTEDGDDRYLGCDLVPELIEHNARRFGSGRVSFLTLDAVSDDLPDADVCLVRQVLQHLPNADILRIVAKLKRFAFVFVTEGQPKIVEGDVNPDKPANSDVRFDWRTGRGRGVELAQPPYNLQLRRVCALERPAEIIVTDQVL